MHTDRIDVNKFERGFVEHFGRPGNITMFVGTRMKYLVELRKIKFFIFGCNSKRNTSSKDTVSISVANAKIQLTV